MAARAAGGVDEYQRPGDAEPQRAGLAGHTAAGDPRHDVELAIRAQGYERLVDQLLVHLVREVDVHGPAVDQPLPGPRHHPHPGDRLLAAAGAKRVPGHDRPTRRGLARGARRLTGLGGVLRHVLGGLVDLVASAGVRRDSGLSHGVFLVLPDRIVVSWCRPGRLLRGLARARLLGNLRDLEGDRLLRLMRVLGSRVDLELAQHLPAESVLGEHALYRLGDGTLGTGRHQVGVRDGPQAARVSGVPVRALVGQLVAGQRDLRRVHDDDEVARVDMRREDRLVLAAQQDSRLARQPAEDDVRRIDDMPLSLDIGGLRAESAHSHEPSRVSPDGWSPRPVRWPGRDIRNTGGSMTCPLSGRADVPVQVDARQGYRLLPPAVKRPMRSTRSHPPNRTLAWSRRPQSRLPDSLA